MKTFKITLIACSLLWTSFAQAKNSPKKVVAKTNIKVGMQVMVNAFMNRSKGVTYTIVKKDLRNGYMKYKAKFSSNQISQGEFAYYTTSDGREMLATTTLMCMQACSTMLEFFAYRNNKLITLNQQIVGMITMDKFHTEARKHISTRMSQNEKNRQAKGEMALYSEIIKLPQHGTTIIIQKDSRVDRRATTMAELRYNYNTGRFVFVKK